MKDKLIEVLKDCIQRMPDNMNINILPSKEQGIGEIINVSYTIKMTTELFDDLINKEDNKEK